MKAKRPSLLLLTLVVGLSASTPTLSAQEPATAAVADAGFSFSCQDLPIKQALALFARANHLNVIPDLDVEGSVTVDFRDLPLDLAMQALLEAHGYYFTQERGLIRVRNQESRMFEIDYIQATRAGQGSNAVQISSGAGENGSGGSQSSARGQEGSTMTVTNTSTIDFWSDLSEQLQTMVSESGRFTVNSLSGTVMVTDSHRRVESIAAFLASVTTSIVRQIELEVEIYEVALSDATQLGINWSRISDRLDTSFSTFLPAGGGVIVDAPAYGPAPGAPAIQVQHTRGGTTAILEALRQEGNLRVVSKPRLRTLNNQPAVVRVGQDIPVFIRQVIQSPGNPPVITTNETIQTVTVGTVLSITPQVSANGLITLDVTPAVSRLVRMETSGESTAPVIDIRQASSIVRLRDGNTVVMGGLVQDTAATTRRKIPILGDVPLIGRAFTGRHESAERTELVFFLTPRIVHDVATEAAAPAAFTAPLP